MKLGMQVGLGPGHIVLDGDRPSSPSPKQGRSVGGAGGAEHPQVAGAAPVLRMARSTPS